MKYLIIFLLLLLSFSSLKAKYYAGYGIGYNLIQDPNNLINEDFPSLNLHIENRAKCKVWYGLGLNLADIGRNSEAPLESKFFHYYVNLEPSIRYNFIPNNTINYNFIPYVKTSLLIGFIDVEDNLSDRSLGGTLSIGIAKGFNAFDKCFMIDLNGGYSGINTLYRVDGRQFFETLNVNLLLSVKL
jgi:hypothetical protein